MTPVEPLLTPADVAAALRVSRNTARAIMRAQGGTIRVGKQLRWTAARLARYVRTGGSDETGCTPKTRLKDVSTNAVACGGSGDGTTPTSDMPSVPIKPSAVPRLTLLARKKDAERFPPIRMRQSRKP